MAQRVINQSDEQSIFREAVNANFKELYEGGGGEFPLVVEAGIARTLTVVDSHKYIRCTNGSAVALTVGGENVTAWKSSAEIVIEQAGAGQVTLVPGSGVTLRSSSTLKSNAQYSALTLKRVASNEWVVGGDRSAS